MVRMSCFIGDSLVVQSQADINVFFACFDRGIMIMVLLVLELNWDYAYCKVSGFKVSVKLRWLYEIWELD